MKYVIIRDDDISYFCNPELLEKLYGKLFKNQKPVSLSIVPNIRGDIKNLTSENVFFEKENIAFEPFIPPNIRGKKENFLISQNKDLIHFINEKNNLIEILQHGYSHEIIGEEKEFNIKNLTDITFRIKQGKQIISDTFDKAPSFFVPPYDTVSKESLSVIKKNFNGISMVKYPHELLPKKLWLKFLLKKRKKKAYLFWKKFMLVEHYGTIFSRFNSAEYITETVKQLIHNYDIIVLVNHYWEYFFDWKQLDARYFAAWNECIEYLLDRPDVKFINFDQLYQLLV